MKWYSAISSFSNDHYREMLYAAMVSCIQNTTLKPYVVTDIETDYTNSLKTKFGATIVLSPENSIFNEFCKQIPDLKPTAGTYLRTDIPIVETDDEYVLYTDVDVLFGDLKKQKNALTAPEYFAVAPEMSVYDLNHFNGGCMLINVKGLKSDYEQFSAFVKANFKELFKVSHDQGAYSSFYKNRWSRLSEKYNWKPYWGINPECAILHFHGPKPYHVKAYFDNNKLKQIFDGDLGGYKTISSLIEMNANSYKHYISVYQDFVNKANC